MHPNPRELSNQRRQMQQQARRADASAFFNMLTGDELFGAVESLLPAHRERLFPPTETLAMFLAQAMSADRSCQKAVNDAAVNRLLTGLPSCSTATGGYCRARRRLPLEMVSTLVRTSGHSMASRSPYPWQWQGRPVRLVDGTTVSMPDTPANQAAYPQPRSQKPGLGFPLCRLVGLLCLTSGAVLDAAIAPHRGKGTDEHTLLRTLLDNLDTGDILLGDALFPTYFLLCELKRRGVDGVFQQLGGRQRIVDFNRGQKLGSGDHLVVLEKPKARPDWMSQAQYDEAPARLTVRELKAGGKVLVTTLLDPRQTPKPALDELFRSRWHVEVDLRNLKTTLGLECLSCKTPDMAMKELWVYLLAHNLIRLLMLQAAVAAGQRPRELSFKHCLQLYLAWHTRLQFAEVQVQFAELLPLMSEREVGKRPRRIEPRAVKRRPKPYSLLVQPRPIARAEVARNGHPKKLK